MKFKERELRQEVTKAVKDYLDELIHTRRETGGMALHQNNLALHGHSLHPKESVPDTEQLLQSFVSPRTKLLKNRTNANTYKLGTRDQLRSKSVPVPYAPEKGNIEPIISSAVAKTPYSIHDQDQQQCTMCNPPAEHKDTEDHWIVWRNTLSVKNKSKEKRSPSAPPRSARKLAPSRPTSGIPIPSHMLASRPVTPADRLINATPIPDSPVLRELTPLTLPPKTPENLSRPATARQLSRPHTAHPPGTPAEIIRNITPSEFDVKKDAMTSSAPPTFLQENGSSKLSGMEEWVKNADNYEREVAYKLMKTTNGNRSATSELIRARQRMRGKFADTPMQRPGVSNRGPQGSARHQQPALEALIYQAVNKALERHDQRHLMSQYEYARQDSGRPRAQHMSQITRPKEYIHEGSVFTTANGPYKSSFIIHPEWVSESKTRRSKPALVPAHYRPVEEHRYSTSMPMYKCN